MDDPLLHACDANLWAANAAYFGASLKGEAVESHDLFITHCGFPETEFNRAFLKNPGADLAAAFARAEAYFAGVGLPFAFTVRSDREAECAGALRKAGYVRQGKTPAMLLAPIRDESVAVPGLAIHELASDEDLVRFRETAFDGFGLPKQIAALFLTEQLRRRPGTKLYLGCVDGAPACTASLLLTPGVAGIYWVATLPPFRKRGLGAAITWAAVRGGIEAGAVVASLQASAAGEAVYTRMGFTTPFHYAKYTRP